MRREGKGGDPLDGVWGRVRLAPCLVTWEPIRRKPSNFHPPPHTYTYWIVGQAVEDKMAWFF